MRSFAFRCCALVVAAVVIGCDGASGDGEPGDDQGDDQEDEDTSLDTEPAGAGAPITGLELVRIQACQTVCADVMVEHEEVAPFAPLFPGKPLVLRAYVRVLVGWDYRSALARFEVGAPGLEDIVVETKRVIEESSSAGDVASTLDIHVPPEYAVDGLAFSFGLFEVEGATDGDETPTVPAPVWPAQDRAIVPIEEPPAPLRVVLVPVRYNHDGSGRLPDTSPAQLERFEELFVAMYPLIEAAFEVRAPMDWDRETTPAGDGWEALLMEITALRDADGAGFDAYYYGLFDPAESFSEFCGAGCVLGLSHLAGNAQDAWARASIGLGFADGTADTTMVHEVGHAHGLGHAPCGGVVGVDADFPQPDGTIGDPGYDSIEDAVVSAGVFDFMSYCDPDWIGGYHFNMLHARALAVNGSGKGLVERGAPLRTLVIAANGEAASGPVLHPAVVPDGREVTVELLDGAGRVATRVAGVLRPFSRAGGGVVLFEAPDGFEGEARLADDQGSSGRGGQAGQSAGQLHLFSPSPQVPLPQ